MRHKCTPQKFEYTYYCHYLVNLYVCVDGNKVKNGSVTGCSVYTLYV